MVERSKKRKRKTMERKEKIKKEIIRLMQLQISQPGDKEKTKILINNLINIYHKL